MVKDTKKGLFILVEVLAFVIFLLLCLGIFYLAKVRNVSEEVVNKEISLKYIIDDSLKMDIDVVLDKEDMEELYDLAKNLKFGTSETKCEVDPKYYMEYDENKLYLDESCGLAIYNDKTYSVTKGSKEILEFLKKKIDSLNNVYLFSYDQEKQKAKAIELTDDVKNEIRDAWGRNDKTELTMNLAIILGYVLYIDGDVIGMDDIDGYVSYNGKAAGNFIILSQEMKDILNNKVFSRNNSGNDDCCSCCPNLQPGEVCIDMCCPCSNAN